LEKPHPPIKFGKEFENEKEKKEKGKVKGTV
jgi:hypothetical protein